MNGHKAIPPRPKDMPQGRIDPRDHEEDEVRVVQDPKTGRTMVDGQRVADSFDELARALGTGKLESDVENAVYEYLDESYQAEEEKLAW